jgi:alpha-1,2-mannosyltransferase
MSQRRLSTREGVVLLAIAFAALVSGFYFAGKSGSNPESYRNDFNVYYHAAREVIAARDPYQHSLGDWTPYIYPPLLAEVLIPLALLPLPVAAYVWFLISAASIIWTASMSASLAFLDRGWGDKRERLSEPAQLRGTIAACAVVLVIRFVLDTFSLGQVNAIVAALTVAHLYLYARGRKGLSAIALVLAISIKLTPALLLLYHITKLRLKFAAACGALLFVITAASFLPFGLSGVTVFKTFWSRTVKNEQGYDFAYSGNQSLRGAIARANKSEASPWALPQSDESRKPADPTTILISIALLAVATFAAVRARDDLAAAAPFFCGMVLLSPLSWKAHYVILILPAAYLFYVAKTSGNAGRLVAAILAVAFVLFNLTSPNVIGLAAAEWADAHSLVFMGALLIFIASLPFADHTQRTAKTE